MNRSIKSALGTIILAMLGFFSGTDVVISQYQDQDGYAVSVGNRENLQSAPQVSSHFARAWPQAQYVGQTEPTWQQAVSNTAPHIPQQPCVPVYINGGGFVAPTGVASSVPVSASQPMIFSVAPSTSVPTPSTSPSAFPQVQQTIMPRIATASPNLVQAPVPPQSRQSAQPPQMSPIPFASIDNHNGPANQQTGHRGNDPVNPIYRQSNINIPQRHVQGFPQTVVVASANLPLPTESFENLSNPIPLPASLGNEIPQHDMPLEIPEEPPQVHGAIPNFAMPDDGYSIAQLQQMALQSNPMLIKKQREIQATHGVWLQSGLYANPTVGFVGDDYADNGTQGKQGVSLEQEIIRGNKLGIARNVERWSIEIAKQEWEIARVKVINDVKALAWDYIVAVYLVEANRALLNIAEESVRTSVNLVKINELGRNELLQNRILRNRTLVELSKAEQDEQEKWQQLAAMIGQPMLPKKGISDAIRHAEFEFDQEQIWQRLLAESPEIKLEQLKKRKADCVIAQEKAEAVPNITVGGTLSYHVNDKAMVGDIGVSMPLRVYDRNQGNIRRAQADAMAQSSETERVRLELRRRLSTEWNNYVKAGTVLKHYETDILIDAREGINLVLQGMRQEEMTSLELLIAQQTYIQTLIEYIDAVRDSAISSTYINGLLLTGGLDAN